MESLQALPVFGTHLEDAVADSGVEGLEFPAQFGGALEIELVEYQDRAHTARLHENEKPIDQLRGGSGGLQSHDHEDAVEVRREDLRRSPPTPTDQFRGTLIDLLDGPYVVRAGHVDPVPDDDSATGARLALEATSERRLDAPTVGEGNHIDPAAGLVHHSFQGRGHGRGTEKPRRSTRLRRG